MLDKDSSALNKSKYWKYVVFTLSIPSVQPTIVNVSQRYMSVWTRYGSEFIDVIITRSCLRHQLLPAWSTASHTRCNMNAPRTRTLHQYSLALLTHAHNHTWAHTCTNSSCVTVQSNPMLITDGYTTKRIRNEGSKAYNSIECIRQRRQYSER